MAPTENHYTRWSRRAVSAADEFDALVGSGGVYASGLDVGADGGILALATVVPGRVAELAAAHARADGETAPSIQSELAPLTAVVVGEYGVPGVKAALEMCDRSARRVLRSPEGTARDAVRNRLARHGAL